MTLLIPHLWNIQEYDIKGDLFNAGFDGINKIRQN